MTRVECFSASCPVQTVVFVKKVSCWPLLWRFLSFTSVVIHWDHPGANRSLQSIFPRLKLDCHEAESGCALLRLNRNTYGIALFRLPICGSCRRARGSPSGGSRAVPRPVCSSLSPHCTSFSLHVPLCPCLNRTMQTKWPSKWAVACLLWSKFCRSSLLLPHPLQCLVFPSSEYHHPIQVFTF